MRKNLYLTLIFAGFYSHIILSSAHQNEHKKGKTQPSIHSSPTEHSSTSSPQTSQASPVQEDKNLMDLCQEFIHQAQGLAENQKGRNELKTKMGKEKYEHMVEQAFQAYKKVFDYTKEHKKSGVSKTIYEKTKQATKNLFNAKHITNMVLRLPATSK